MHLLLRTDNFLAGNTAQMSRVHDEMHQDTRSLTSRGTAFVVVQPSRFSPFRCVVLRSTGGCIGAFAHFHLRVEWPLLAGFNAGHGFGPLFLL